MAIGALFPLGWLSLNQAGNIWFLVNLLTLFLIVWLGIRDKKISIVLLAALALAVVLFPPTILHLRLGQITLIICLSYLLVVSLLDKSRVLLACLLIAFSLVKPQLSILVLPGILISYYREKGARATFGFVALIILCSALLTIPLFLAFPSWTNDFVDSIRQNPEYLQPSLFSLLPNWIGDIGYIIWGLAAIVVMVINIWLWNSKKREDAIYWSLAMTPLVTPYVWGWDFVMVLPLFARSFITLNKRWKLGLLLAAYCLCWMLNLYVQFETDISNHRYWPIPWIILLTIGALYISKEHFLSAPKFVTSIVGRLSEQEKDIAQ